MRPLLITLAGACASLGASLAVWVAIEFDERPYFEPLQGALLRTTAEAPLLQAAVDRALEMTRPHHRSLEKALEDCDYRERAEVWFTEPDMFGQVQERACRLAREQTDRTGQRLRIEVLRGDDMPALVFVHHDDPDMASRVVAHLGNELQTLGVARR
jgi:hypothetical protein